MFLFAMKYCNFLKMPPINACPLTFPQHNAIVIKELAYVKRDKAS
jgi:hypothetical protein